MKENKNINVNFPIKKIIGKRNWGKEELLVLIPKKISLKKIFIKKGKKGGLQYHHKKNECGILISGKLKITYDNGKGRLISKILTKNSSFHFPPGAVHQEEALSNCTIIEASTPYFNDRVRVEKNYGLMETKGLPTTKKSSVKFL